MTKKSKKSIYDDGGMIAANRDNSQFLQPDLSQYSGLGNIAGSLLETSNSPVGTIGGGILKGAAGGAALGPIGAGVGAILGGIGGVFKNKQNKEAEELQQKLQMQQANMQSLQNFQSANKMYQEGGSLNQQNNITQYNGMPHELGGLPLGENTEVEDNETRGIMNTKDYIFSDSLKPDKKSKKTFADISKDIEKKFKNYETDKFASKAKDMALSKLMYEQEAFKKNKFEKGIQETWTKYGGFIGQNKLFALGGGIGDGIIEDPSQTNNRDSAYSANMYIKSLQEPMFNALNSYEKTFGEKAKDNVNYQKGYEGGKQYVKNNMILSNKQVIDYATYWDDLPDNIRGALSPMDLKRIESIKSKMKCGGKIMSMGGPIDPPGGPGDGKTNKNKNKYQRGSIQDYTDEAKDQYNRLTSELYKGNPGVKEYLGYQMMHSDNPEYIKMLNSKTPYSGGDMEIGSYYPDIDTNRFENLDANYSKRAVRYPITEKQYISNPDIYGAFMSPTRKRELDEYLLGKKPESQLINAPKLEKNVVTDYVTNQLANEEAPKIHELDVQIKNKYGGFMKYPDGGYLDINKIQSPQFDFNLNPETKMNMDLFNKYKGVSNQNQVEQDPNYNVTRMSSETPVGLSDTQGGIYDAKLKDVNNINYNKPGTFWNQKENIGKSFTPESTYKYMTNDLGVDPTFAKQLTNDPKLMQGYFEYVKQAPESFFQQRKQLYPAYSKEQAIGEKDRYGQHHQWTLDPEQLNSYKEFLTPNPLQPLKNIPPQLSYPPNEPSLDQMRNDLTGGPPQGLDNNVPPENYGGPPQGGNLKPFGPDWVASGVSTLPNIGMGIGNISLANNLNFDRTKAEIYNPDYVDPTRAIQETRNQYAGAKDLIRQNAGGAGSYMSNILGATAGQSEAESGIQSQYDNANAGIYNQSATFNAQQKQQANNINAQIQQNEALQKTNLKQQGYQNLSDALNTGINTYYQSKRDADKMNLAGGENFYYKRIGSLANQKPVKVFKGNGFHYYEDPTTGQLRYLDPDTGKQVKDKNKINKFSKEMSSSNTNSNMNDLLSKLTPSEREYVKQHYNI